MYDYLSDEELLKAPVKRAAFTDRMAYVMAEMSRLAYFKFEGGSNLDEIMVEVKKYVPEKVAQEKVEGLIRSITVTNDPSDAERIFAEILKTKGFDLVRAFNARSTNAQAFLCRKPELKMAVLAFRGTEKCLKDIKADATAFLDEVPHKGTTVSIHRGYYQQFKSLLDEEKLDEILKSDEIKNDQLFITGHSLGGALAITAVKFLASDATGACYTFGSPPVGTKDFDNDIKTPIYRIINHVDIVPRLPNPYLVLGVRGIGVLLELVLSPIAGLYEKIRSYGWYKKLELLLLDAKQYRQSGYGSYLVGNSSNARLRYDVSSYDEIIWWFKQLKNIFRGDMEIISDHSIKQYSEMLQTWARSRL